MRIISSQRYINFDIVDEKIKEMEGLDKITLPIVDAGMKNANGENLFILVDGHHRKEAAEELGIKVCYKEIKNEYGCIGDELLESCWMDSDWYYVDNGRLVF